MKILYGEKRVRKRLRSDALRRAGGGWFNVNVVLVCECSRERYSKSLQLVQICQRCRQMRVALLYVSYYTITTQSGPKSVVIFIDCMFTYMC